MMPTTYPVGGYVNMNQLAHMALQHQGLCPTADRKPDCEDIGRHGPSHGGRDRWDEAGPRSQQQLTPPHSGNVANIGEYRQTFLSGYTHTRLFNDPLSGTTHCLQCFDAVGWAAGRASGL